LILKGSNRTAREGRISAYRGKEFDPEGIEQDSPWGQDFSIQRQGI